MYHPDWREKASSLQYKGTTTVGAVCKDGVVLATDTRVTMGYFIAHKHGKKVHRIDDHLAMTMAGVVADAQAVLEILRVNASLYKLNNKRPMPVASAARLASNVLFYNRLLPLIIQAIIAGVDSEGPHIFSLDPFGSLTEEKKFFATGSGSPVAFGILEDGYKEDMTVEEAVPLMVKAVKAAMRRDAASGDSFDVAIIDSKGFKELSEEEKAKYA
ncbi:MAG: archaeal proteasome endopeptidase complex subunit beta [Candidatus Hecatellaceae archaeon]|nr:MAG: proteasome endopeptidase complex, archaeal, beta subunit [Candidatus Hecatellales archaeon]